jgi:hypothetical protein
MGGERPAKFVRFQYAGIVGQRAIARALEARGVPTMRGGRWSAVHVSNILKRLSS